MRISINLQIQGNMFYMLQLESDFCFFRVEFVHFCNVKEKFFATIDTIQEKPYTSHSNIRQNSSSSKPPKLHNLKLIEWKETQKKETLFSKNFSRFENFVFLC